MLQIAARKTLGGLVFTLQGLLVQGEEDAVLLSFGNETPQSVIDVFMQRAPDWFVPNRHGHELEEWMFDLTAMKNHVTLMHSGARYPDWFDGYAAVAPEGMAEFWITADSLTDSPQDTP